MNKILFFLLLAIFLTGCQSPFIKQTTVEKDELIELKQQAAAAYKNQQYEQALPMYQQLNEAVPNDAMLWFRTGNIHARLHDPQKALDCYQTAVKFDPHLATAWHNMAVLQLRQAANTLTQMVQHIKPNDPLYPRAVRLSEATLDILGVRREKTAE